MLIRDQRQWPQAVDDVEVIARRPFAEFKAAIDAKIAGPATQASDGKPSNDQATEAATT